MPTACLKSGAGTVFGLLGGFDAAPSPLFRMSANSATRKFALRSMLRQGPAQMGPIVREAAQHTTKHRRGGGPSFTLQNQQTRILRLR